MFGGMLECTDGRNIFGILANFCERSAAINYYYTVSCQCCSFVITVTIVACAVQSVRLPPPPKPYADRTSRKNSPRSTSSTTPLPCLRLVIPVY